MCFSLGSRNAGAASARFNASYTATAMREIRSEEHTSELQSQSNLVCRLLLEKKKQAIFSPSIRLQPPHAPASALHCRVTPAHNQHAVRHTFLHTTDHRGLLPHVSRHTHTNY